VNSEDSALPLATEGTQEFAAATEKLCVFVSLCSIKKKSLCLCVQKKRATTWAALVQTKN
jgi:hypothetical protein